jgi:hypothetical protein
LILSGEFFNPRSRSPSPARSASPEWDRDYTHDDEYDSSVAKNAAIEKMLGSAVDTGEADGGIGVGVQGRTGVKGVIRDRAEAQSRERKKHARDVRTLNENMEKTALSARTWREDEVAAKAERARDEGRELSDDEHDLGRQTIWGAHKGRFGHLREVGITSFVEAVEEERGTWVVVHLYEQVCMPTRSHLALLIASQSLERCYTLDEELSHLARLHPDTKFLRARAAVLGFASYSSSKPSSTQRAPRHRIIKDDDDDDPYGSADKDEDLDKLDDDVDVDVLPTLLAYRDGEVVHTWVRVDWEAQAVGGVEELLVRYALHSISHLIAC